MTTIPHEPADLPFRDSSLPLAERVEDLLTRLECDEKLALLRHDSPAVERLGIPPHNWWNECLHGVGRSGLATVFPQAIGMAATFDAELLHRVAKAAADEARAKHHEAARHGNYGMYKGLTYWTPNINIFRDPRWGRGQETYGEDPYLTSRLVVAFVTGLQGDDPHVFKLVATPKHFAVHSGPEALRHSFDARVSLKDLWETYLPGFYEGIVVAGAYSVMGAYNRTNGAPCCAHPYLMNEVLRDRWDFDGYVVSDCWAIQDFHQGHGTTRSPQESAALAIKLGCDLNCGCEYKNLQKALDEGLVTLTEIEVCLRRVLAARFQLGMFDPPESNRYMQIPFDVVACDAHVALARRVAAQSCVLLRNDAALLPLDRSARKRIAIVGPNATNDRALIGNYSGEAAMPMNILRGIREALPDDVRILYSRGCDLLAEGNVALGVEDRYLSEALSVAERADLVIAVMGLDPTLEGEQGDASNSDAAGDRTQLGLPGLQAETLRALLELGKPLVLITMAGSPISLPEFEGMLATHLHVWYPGQEGGRAVADVLFGDAEPGGRLPITFPRSVADIPPIENYAMSGRTYRYATAEPMYPFGYGLSYTEFTYSEFTCTAGGEIALGAPIALSVSVANRGKRSGSDIVQLYLRHDDELGVPLPHHQLVAFRRVELAPGESRTIDFELSPRSYSFIDAEGRCRYSPGAITLFAGGSQPDARSVTLLGAAPRSLTLQIVGEPRFDSEYGATGRVRRRHRN